MPVYFIWLCTCTEQILSTYEVQYPYVFYVKYKVDSCPAKRQFDFWPPAIFGGCPLTFILTEDKDQSTEYNIIGVPPSCTSCTIVFLCGWTKDKRVMHVDNAFTKYWKCSRVASYIWFKELWYIYTLAIKESINLLMVVIQYNKTLIFFCLKYVLISTLRTI